MIKNSIITIDKIGGVISEEGEFLANGKNKEIIWREVERVLGDIAEINETLNDKSVDNIPCFKEWSELKEKRDSLFEKVWKLYTDYYEIKTINEHPQNVPLVNNNYGIVVGGNLTIEKVDLVVGEGVRSVRGFRQEETDNENVAEDSTQDADGCKENYPKITEANTSFFEDYFYAASDVKGVQRPRLKLPKEKLLHIIYDKTRQWDPLVETSVHKWRLLYELLRRLTYFKVAKRPRYHDFVNAVVRYCFPNVRDAYNNNFSKTVLPEHFEEWKNEDQTLFLDLKKALSFEKRLP